MDLFKKEQKISIQFPKDNMIVEMSCAIENVYNDRLDVLLPQYFMRYIQYLQVGSQLMAKVFTKLGTIDFSTVVISSPLEDAFTIELDYNAVKLCPDLANAEINATEELNIVSGNEIIKAETISISANGLKFRTDADLKVGIEYNCRLLLPNDYGIIEFKAEITDVDEIYDNEYTATFSTITEGNIQILMYYMYMYEKNYTVN